MSPMRRKMAAREVLDHFEKEKRKYKTAHRQPHFILTHYMYVILSRKCGKERRQRPTIRPTIVITPLAVALEVERVVLLPVAAARRADEGVRPVAALPEATVLASSGCEAAKLAVLVRGGNDPVDARVLPDGGVLGVDEDDLEVLVRGVLVDPVGVEHAEISALAANALLGDRAERAAGLDLVDTVVLGLTVDNALAVRPLASSPADRNAVHNEALLGLVSEAVRLIRPRGSVQLGDLALLAVFPRANAKKKAHLSLCFLRHSSSMYL